MATVYSLICFGGRTGKTVTISNASPAVVTLTNHGLRDGFGVVFSTTGALPAGISAGTTYYAKSTASNAFNLYDTAENAIAGGTTGRVNTSSAGSGTHTVKSAWLVGLSSLSRWGSSGAERIYDGLVNCLSARSSGATIFDTEVFEVGEDFIDNITTNALNFQMSCPKTTIRPINNAGHNGVFDAGFTVLTSNPSVASGCFIIQCPVEVYGITFKHTADGSFINCANPLSVINSCVFIGPSIYSANSTYGIRTVSSYSTYTNNLIVGLKLGFQIEPSQTGQLIANNTVTKNDTGFYSVSPSATYGYFWDNISVGNVTANWSSQPTGINGAGKNAGLSTDPTWKTGTNTAVSMTTSDFGNYSTNSYRAALASSPQVDSGIDYYNMTLLDVAGSEVPNYNNGGAEFRDIGCFEFDHGYGPHPASHILTLNNVVVDSRVFIRDQADTVTHFDQIAAASTVTATITVYGDSRDNWRIKVRNASGSPAYVPYETLMTATAGSSSLYVSQIPDE